uniref:Uncharacterized protein n=1 Tax=Anguilla anguilla TaxID=7936 RepID=A0A0E9XD17_ANGAN
MTGSPQQWDKDWVWEADTLRPEFNQHLFLTLTVN